MLFFSIALVLTSVPSILFVDFLWRTGYTVPKIVLSVLFILLIGNVAWGATHAFVGFFVRITGGRYLHIEENLVDDDDSPLPSVAIVLPVYNEEPMRVFAGLKAMYLSLAKTGQLDSFDFFILSDSTNSERWVEEEEAWTVLCRDLNAFGRINYRRRKVNTDRKAGNILEFCQDWGKRYRYMITLDADSIMTGESIAKLTRIMENFPRIGICQTAPRIVFGDSFWGRLQQFANRFYGPIFMEGLNFWQQGDGNYWGHNAIIRLAPFMEHCALPNLPGREPFGGKILSHDFVEAALMRRAGYEVWLAGGIEGSYEEGPQDIIEHAKRDRRWCQGNLQHFWLLCSRGLLPGSRIHLANGIMGYASSLLWLSFLVLGGIIAYNRARSQLTIIPSVGFANVYDFSLQEHAIIITFITLSMLFAPKLLAVIEALWSSSRRKSFGGSGKLILSALLETLVSVFIAPLFMFYHSRFVVATALGKGVTWKTQNRDAGEGLTVWQTFLAHWGHVLLGLLFAIGSFHISITMFAWLGPVWLGLMLAPLTSSILSRPTIGHRLRKAGILLSPEETRQDEALESTKLICETSTASKSDRDTGPFHGFLKAVADPYVNAIRVALASNDGDGKGKAKQIWALRALKMGPQALNRSERQAILDDPEALLNLHHRLWAMEPNELHEDWRKVIASFRIL